MYGSVYGDGDEAGGQYGNEDGEVEGGTGAGGLTATGQLPS